VVSGLSAKQLADIELISPPTPAPNNAVQISAVTMPQLSSGNAPQQLAGRQRAHRVGGGALRDADRCVDLVDPDRGLLRRGNSGSANGCVRALNRSRRW